MKEQVFNIIKQNEKITFKNISKKINISSDELQKILLELKLEGSILQLSNKYMLFPKDLYLGNIIASTSGRKYILYNGKKLQIAESYIDEVLLHDVVSFKINENSEAEIVSIVDRTIGKMTCEVMSIDGKKKIVPYRDGINITLPKEITDSLFPGDIILVRITPDDIFEYCNATFIKKIGRKDDPDMDDEVIALNYGFGNDYTEEYLEEISKYPTSVSDEEIIGRSDFRNQLSCTIDGVYTKDMDDGVFAERINDNIIRVYVHIADVSYYIKPGSLAFERACEKTTSLYTNNSVFHMLHYVISNGICSLNPYVDRLTKTIIMDIDTSGNIVSFDVVKSVINSKKKMDYDSVDEILVKSNVPAGYENFINEILLLNEAANRLEKRYVLNGKITFASNELNKTYNQDGSLNEVKDMEDSPSRKIIENLMIAANETVATWLYNMSIPSVYRILEQPNKETINSVIDMLNKSGFHIRRITDVDDSKTIQKILDKIHDFDEYPLISQLLVMGMQRARYSVDNIGHYALGLEAYSHFTSPIRRLPDLLVHTIVDAVLSDFNKFLECDLSKLESDLEELCMHASRMERQADMAENDSERRLIIKKLENLEGEELEAIVCETNKRIRIKVLGIDTYIDERSLGDNFIFDKKRKLYYDKYSNTYLNLGTKIMVKIIGANSANRSFRVIVLGTINNKVKKKIK